VGREAPRRLLPGQAEVQDVAPPTGAPAEGVAGVPVVLQADEEDPHAGLLAAAVQLQEQVAAHAVAVDREVVEHVGRQVDAADER